VKADVWLDRRLAGLDSTVRQACNGLIDDAESECLAPLREALHAAASSYDELAGDLMASLQDDAEGFPPTPQRLVEAERSFRTAVLADVVRPLEAHLSSAVIGAWIAARWEKAQADLESRLRKLPKTVRRTEPAALYQGTGSDSPVVRVRKAWVRMGHKLRRGEADKQVVPYRALVTYHVRARASALLAGLAEDLQQAVAIPMARMEIGVDHLLSGMREVESQMDPTSFLVPDALLSIVPAKETITSGEIDPAAGRNALLEQVRSIGDAFRSAADASVSVLPRENLVRAVDLARDALARDVEVSGSFMSNMRRRTPPQEGEGPADEARRRGERWTEWQREVLARVTELRLLLKFGDEIDDIEATVVREVLEDCVLDWLQRCREAAGEIRSRGEAVEKALSAIPPDEGARLAAEIKARLADLSAYLGAKLIEPGSPGGVVRSATGKSLDTLFTGIRSIPESLTVHVIADADVEAVDPFASVLNVRLRQALEQSFDAFVIERLRQAPDSIATALDASYAEAKSAADIYEYNLTAAVEELGEGDVDPRFVAGTANPDDERGVDRALELVANGYSATAVALDGMQEHLEVPVGSFVGEWIPAFSAAWGQRLERVRAATAAGERMPAIGSHISGGLRTGLRGSQARARRRVSTTLTQVDRLKRATRHLIRTGRRAVHKPEASGQGAFPTLAAVRQLATMLEDLPVVYRRLFGFLPVSGALLAGRDSTIIAASRHYGSWKRGLTNPLLIVGQPGSGKTSILRHLKEVTLLEIDPVMIQITSALSSEAEVVELLAGAVGIESPEEGTFRALTAAVVKLPADASRVCLIDNLEHVLVRTVGGSLLAKRTITFLSRTDSRVLWIATMNSHAWQFIERTESSAAALIVTERINSLDREKLETAFISRHQRSGLPLQFEVRKKPHPLLRRRLRRAMTEEKRQAILRTEYFDRLHRAALGNFTLAIFYWLRSAEFDDAERQVRMRPVRPLDFGYLSRLSKDQAFALKAFLEHRALAVEDHQKIFDSTFQRSMEIFESLGNAYLIRPSDSSAVREAWTFETMQEGVPYTVSQLMHGPVTQVLRNRHILY
jgi:hypothetical protein